MNTIFPQKLRNWLSLQKLRQLRPWLSDKVTEYVSLFGVWLGKRGISIAQWANRRKARKL